MREYHREDLAAAVCRAVAELPDRNSPADWPEAMLVTHDELQKIVTEAAMTASLQAYGESEAWATMELLRNAFCKLQRYSFHLVSGGVRRVPERYGNWVEFDAGHQLFDAEVLAGLQAGAQAEQVVARAKGGTDA